MINIMIVDDEIYFATNLAKLLKENNRELDTIAVYSAEEALKRLEQAPVDIVVSDIKLQNMDGIKFVKIIKSKWPDISIIVMTAYGTKEIMMTAFSIGTLFYIEKPFRVEKLENLITMVNIRRTGSTTVKEAAMNEEVHK